MCLWGFTVRGCLSRHFLLFVAEQRQTVAPERRTVRYTGFNFRLEVGKDFKKSSFFWGKKLIKSRLVTSILNVFSWIIPFQCKHWGKLCSSILSPFKALKWNTRISFTLKGHIIFFVSFSISSYQTFVSSIQDENINIRWIRNRASVNGSHFSNCPSQSRCYKKLHNCCCLNFSWRWKCGLYKHLRQKDLESKHKW